MASYPPFPIALLTDFGAASHYVGILHGVAARWAPAVRVIDLTHAVQPQNLIEASICLEAAIDYFPESTVFCCVVDPGVGTDRRAIVATDGRHTFISPDNGLLTLVERKAQEEGRHWSVFTFELQRMGMTHPISSTFHGRDVFAPAAAILARDGNAILKRIADPLDSWERLNIPEPVLDPKQGRGSIAVLTSDVFGNLLTSLRHRDWEQPPKGGLPEGMQWPPSLETVEVRIQDTLLTGIARTFGDVEVGQPVAYWGSSDRLEIAVRNGNAANRFSVVDQTPVTLHWKLEPKRTQ